ncbi:hypothetical protein F4825DRAFT_416960 [Nemania diffusa]|nr:hypothetical protein F4825DRAFT_416960 [Nemania diffusa]
MYACYCICLLYACYCICLLYARYRYHMLYAVECRPPPPFQVPIGQVLPADLQYARNPSSFLQLDTNRSWRALFTIPSRRRHPGTQNVSTYNEQ